MVIETKDLTKLYGTKVGCEKICLSVSGGQVFGFLGPNGAGKSTLVKMLVGLIYPTSGSAEILGAPLGNVEVRRRLGFLPENFKYQDWLTGRELLRFHAALGRIPSAKRESQIDEVLKTVKLERADNYRVRTYSKGMQQRIGIAAALITNPELLFLDEPTSALDPIGRKEVREIITGLRDRGTAVFLNSHLLSEIEMVCDQVAIINSGRIVAGGTLDNLLRGRIEVEIEAEPLSKTILASIGKLGTITSHNATHLMVEVDNPERIAEIAASIVQSGSRLYNLQQHRRSLEELFVDVITGSEREIERGGDKPS